MKQRERTLNEIRQVKDSVYDHPYDDICHYSGLPSVESYAKDSFKEVERINKLHQKNKIMKKIEMYYPIILAFISFLFSVTLWFAGYKDEGLFVGIWVPSILGLANFFNTLKK